MQDCTHLIDTYTLKNGIEIPKLELGTRFIPNGQAAEAVREAVKIGYRHIDTAQAYKSESGVGEGIRTCAVRNCSRPTKLASEIKTNQGAAETIDGSLARMDLDYLALTLIHSPQLGLISTVVTTPMKTGKHGALGRMSIGLGSFERSVFPIFKEQDVENLLASCTVAPMVNQLLVHIGNTPCGADGVLPEQEHLGGGIFSGGPRRDPEES